MYYGGRIGVFSGNVSKLLDDLQSLKPTIVAFVPRLLTKFEAQIKANLKQKNILVRALFNFAIKVRCLFIYKLANFSQKQKIWEKE
jgi:long-chain acyl-CoA synthetase